MCENVKKTPRYPYVLLDADRTLFDFDRAEGTALERAFAQFGLPYGEAVLARYREINNGLWREFELGRIDQARLQRRRFETLFGQFGCEANVGQFNLYYIDRLSEGAYLLDGAPETCRELSRFCTLSILTNGIARTQRRRLAGSEIRPYISHMVVSEEAGVQKPNAGFFEYALQACKIPDKSAALMVGDSLAADIRGALDFGLPACWYNPGGADAGDIRPDYEIARLTDLVPIVLGD